MSLKEKAFKGVAWSLLEAGGVQAFSFIVFAILARQLGPDTFGLIAIANVYLAFVQIFIEQGYAAAIVQRPKLEPEHLDTAFWCSLGTSLLLAGASFIAAPLLARIFEVPTLVPVIRALSLVLILSALKGVQAAILTRHLNFKPLALRSLGATLGGGLIGIVLALGGAGVWSLVAQQLASAVIGVVILWSAASWRPGLAVSRRHFRELFGFGVQDLGFNLLNFFNRRADSLLIGFFLGPLALGLYTIAQKILRLMLQLFADVVARVAFPAFSRLQTEPDRLREAFLQTVHRVSLFAFPAFSGVAFLAPDLIPTLFGEQWSPSAPAMRYLAVAGILNSVFRLNSSVLLAMGKPAWRTKLAFLNATTTALAFLFVLTILHGDINSVAIAFLIQSWLFAPLSTAMLLRLIDLRLFQYLRQFADAAMASSVMLGVMAMQSFLLPPEFEGIWRLIVLTFSGASIYGLMILLLRPDLVSQSFRFIHRLLSGRGSERAHHRKATRPLG